MTKQRDFKPSLEFLNIKVGSGRRILAVSDIHGHPELLKRLLERVDFSKKDLLVIVGDIIDKGYDSLGAVRYVMKLCEGKNVIPLLGNVDAARLKAINQLSQADANDFLQYLKDTRQWTGCLWDEMTSELGVICNNTDEILSIYEKVKEHFCKELDFLANLPTLLETEKYVFVHGGLRETNVFANKKCSLSELLKYDNFFAVAPKFEKYVVVGHYPTSLYDEHIANSNPKIDKERKIISIDGGCGIKEYGQLNLLIIPDINSDVSKITFISEDDLKKATVLERREASTNSVNIRWTDNKIKTLKKQAEFRYIRHISTGYELWIPNEYVYNDDYAKDYSDYTLPVKEGDSISLVHKTSRGWLAKKDGVFGWYCGQIQMNTQ